LGLRHAFAYVCTHRAVQGGVRRHRTPLIPRASPCDRKGCTERGLGLTSRKRTWWGCLLLRGGGVLGRRHLRSGLRTLHGLIWIRVRHSRRSGARPTSNLQHHTASPMGDEPSAMSVSEAGPAPPVEAGQEATSAAPAVEPSDFAKDHFTGCATPRIPTHTVPR